MLSEGRVGPRPSADGVVGEHRLGHHMEVMIAQARAKYSEMASRSKLYIASTAVAGVAPGTALSTTPPLAILNPLNSGKEVHIIQTALGYISGTLGAGTIVYGHVSPQATIPTGGTELTPVCTRLGVIRGAGRAFQGSTLASTPVLIRPAFILGAFLATTAEIISPLSDNVDGSIVLPQATCFIMQGVAAAGSTPLVLLTVMWEEIDIV